MNQNEIDTIDTITKEKKDTVNKALLDFVLRVATDPNARLEEIQVLPEVAKVLLKILRPIVFRIDCDM